MKLEKRAVFGWPKSGAGPASPRNGIAIHYDGSDQKLAKQKHTACREYWRDTRKFHMGPSRGWADIGYSFAVCPHGIVLEGRGLNKVQAAQPGGNETWYSVTFMSGPSEAPTAAQVGAFRELRAWLRGKGVAAALRPHSAFISTSCCGNILRNLINNGTLASAASAPSKTEEDDVPDYVSVGVTKAQELPPNTWTTVSWDKDYADSKHQHADEGGPSILWGPALYGLTASLTIKGLPPGTECQMRAVEVQADDTSKQEAGPVLEFTATQGDTYALYALPADSIGAKKRLRVQVIQYGKTPASIAAGGAKVTYWRT